MNDLIATLDAQDTYLDKLDVVVGLLPELLEDVDGWKSLIINKRKPHTYRVYRQFGDYRVCLHKFEGCDEHESFLHPHPWPGAFCIIKGKYLMNVGYSNDLTEKPHMVYRQLQVSGSRYEIDNPKAWHSVTPVGGVVYTLMLNGKPWEEGVHHQSTVTTKGKDLQTMTPKELRAFLTEYRKQYESSLSKDLLYSANSIFAIEPYEWKGLWVFDDESRGLDREPFVAGADTMIEAAALTILGKKADFVMVFSETPFPGHHIALEWVRHEHKGDVYKWANAGIMSGQECWLCPALRKYFVDAAPKGIYVQLKPK